MSPKNKLPLKPLAWNGIVLKIPVTWEVESLDAGHMIIGDQGQAKTEIKWAEAPKKFILAKYLKKFISRSQKQLGIKIHEQATPESFSHLKAYFEFFFFSWESDTSTGDGTLIFCNHCKRLTMIRFFSKSSGLSKALQTSIIQSFDDHPEKNQTLWQVFGLNFPTPSHFKLQEFSFKPGRYGINFKYKKTKLDIFSWGPAEFLLSKQTLSEFAFQQFPQIIGFAKTGFCSHGSYLEWAFKKPRFKNAQMIPLLSHFALFNIFRICHDPEFNRIFGVMVESGKQFEHHIIKGSMLGDV